jgi:hypothetical protein
MKTNDPIPRQDLKALIEENKEFISAINAGASAEELDEIRKRMRANNVQEIPRINNISSSRRSSDEAA